MDSVPPTLDVREDLKAGKEPLPRITAFVDNLEGKTAWRLLATFEPIPLLRFMEGRGYQAATRRLPEGDWEVTFTPFDRKGEPFQGRSSSSSAFPGDPPAGERLQLDNRGLLPPEPMIRVLEQINQLGPDQVLEVWNDREPVFLYPELEKRGYAVRTKKEPDGIRLLIWRR